MTMIQQFGYCHLEIMIINYNIQKQRHRLIGVFYNTKIYSNLMTVILLSISKTKV